MSATMQSTPEVQAKNQIPPSVWVLLLSEVVFRFSFFGIVGIFTKVATENGLTKPQASLAFNVFYGVVFLSCIPGGYFVDRFQISRVTALIGGLFYCAGLCLLDTQIWLAVAALILFAIGFGCLRPLLVALLGDQFDPATQKKLRDDFFAWSYMATNAGALFGFFLGATMKDSLGVDWTARVFGLVGLGAALFILCCPWHLVVRPPAQPKTDTTPPPVQSTAGTTRSWWRVLGVLACVACFWLVYNRTHDWVVDQARSIATPAVAATTSEAQASADKPAGADKQLRITIPVVGLAVRPEQFQLLNPLFIIFLTPFIRPTNPKQTANMLNGLIWMISFIAVVTTFQFVLASNLADGLWWPLVAAYALASIAEIFLAVSAIRYFYAVSANHRALAMGMFYASVGIGELAGVALNLGWGSLFEDTPWTRLWYFLILVVITVIVTICFRAIHRAEAES